MQVTDDIWRLGDYAPTSRQLEPAAQALVERANVRANERVLDLGAGHGNVALAAAERGADVTACDISPTMCANGEQRCRAHGYEIAWHLGDAQALPFDDHAFDVVLSNFAVIFASDHGRAAAELARIVRPGGRMGFTAWTPDGLTAEMIRAGREFTGAPADDGPTMFDWGDSSYVSARFAAFGITISAQVRTVRFNYSSLSAWRADTEAHGLLTLARQQLPAPKYEAMIAVQEALVRTNNVADDPAVTYDASYIEYHLRQP